MFGGIALVSSIMIFVAPEQITVQVKQKAKNRLFGFVFLIEKIRYISDPNNID